MTTIETRRYEMLVRVRDFGLAHGDRFPKSTMGEEAFAAVVAAVNDLNQHAATQFSSRREARGGASTDTAAYRRLVETLDAISRTARAVELDTPGVKDRFRVPRGKGRLAIVSAARAFASDLEPLASQFIAHGMPGDFVSRLKAKIAGVEEALHEREAGKELNASSRASMKAAIDSGLAAVKRLDAIIGNVLGDDAAAKASWTVARRVEQYVGGGRRGSAASPATATTATTATATTPQPSNA